MTTVFLADDQGLVRGGFRMLIEAEDDLSVVGEAADGAAAVKQLTSQPADVVLMDIRMPIMDGVEALRRLRGGEGGRPDVPVVALTADAMSGEVERLIGLGFDDAQPKPIQPAGLIQAIAWRRPSAPAPAAGEASGGLAIA